MGMPQGLQALSSSYIRINTILREGPRCIGVNA